MVINNQQGGSGSVASNHVNLYVNLLALVLEHYGVPNAKVNGTE